MKLLFKILWVGITVFGVGSLIWFLQGVTANFQRNLDLINTGILIYFWIPSFVLVAVSIWMFLHGWNPSSKASYVGFFFGAIVLLSLTLFLVQTVNTQGGVTERVTSDSSKVTIDEKYEYRVDLINLFQRNSHAQLYLKDVTTGVELIIPVGIHTDKIVGIGIKDVNHWVKVEPAGISGRYIMYTTKELGIPTERFKIDIATGTSERVD